MSKPLRRNIGNSRSLKQLRGFNVGIRYANHVTLHGFRSLGRACILLKTFVGIMFQFCFLESQDHWLWEKFLYILITLCTVCTRVYCSVTLNSNSKKNRHVPRFLVLLHLTSKPVIHEKVSYVGKQSSTQSKKEKRKAITTSKVL